MLKPKWDYSVKWNYTFSALQAHLALTFPVFPFGMTGIKTGCCMQL